MKLIIILRRHLPKNAHTWKIFTLTALPVILSSFIFALNSFVDNFMSINIAGGNQALSYANAWTEIQIGIISATTIIGTALFSQYVGKENWYKVKEVINLRMLFALGICLIFALPCAIFPEFMIDLIAGFDEMSSNIKQQAVDYLRLITVAWVLNAWVFTKLMIVRERNHGFISMLTSLITLITNVLLNSIFVYGLGKGIEFLAYSTIISCILSCLFIMTWIWIKERRLFINIFKIFSISEHIAKQFFKRIWSFILFAIGSICINIRFIFWNIGYGTGSIGNDLYRLSSATVLGITGMFFNIFWTTFESMSATVAVYVGKELGKNNIEQAKINARELHGFHMIIGLIIGVIAVVFAFTVVHMNFLTGGYEKEMIDYYKKNPLPNGYSINEIISNGKQTLLLNIRDTLLGITIFIPMFVWFVSRDRFISVGGLTNVVGLVETGIGLFQVAWLAMICFSLTKIGVSFAWAYFIFFLSDIPKWIVYEIVYFKVNWAKNITHSETID